MPIGHSPCIWHTELGCIAFPRIIRLQMISSRYVYKIVGDAKLHRQTGLCSSFRQSIATDLLEHSSDATGAAEVVAGVSGILVLHHLQLVYVPTTSVGTCREEADAFVNICSAAFFAISMQALVFFCFSSQMSFFMLKIVLVPTPSTFLRRSSFLCHLDAGSRLFCFSSRMSFFM